MSEVAIHLQASIRARAEALFEGHRERQWRRTDQTFMWLMLVQWLAAIVVAATWSPTSWAGRSSTVHLHVYAAILLGGVLSSLPIALAMLRPGWVGTRQVIAVSQMLWSALLIHLSGGRIETHFHVFGSLAFLALYRDWRVLVTATVVVAGDHLLRGILWPASVYGVLNPEWWRFLEHAFWVVFEDIVLIGACVAGVREWRLISERQAQIEALRASQEDKARALDASLRQLRTSQEAQSRTERLAAVGQLASNIGGELRRPLAALHDAHADLRRRLSISPNGEIVRLEPRLQLQLEAIEREIAACTRIADGLLTTAPIELGRGAPAGLEPAMGSRPLPRARRPTA
jgi:two-component system, NtrC family, sensor histidine kinase HydH